MERKRFALAVLTGGVTIAVVGGVLYGVVFALFFAANMGSAVGVMKSPSSVATMKTSSPTSGERGCAVGG